MLTDQLTDSLRYWQHSLDSYDHRSFFIKPGDHSWSVGQVYIHLINETNFFLSQVRLCLSSDENETEVATIHGLEMLAKNEFPDELIEGPPSNLLVEQPSSMEQVKEALNRLQAEIEAISILSMKINGRGKSKHPGLGYFNAEEWCRFAGMHVRHHRSQKDRIDLFLSKTDIYK